jgi:hypothetical protein
MKRCSLVLLLAFAAGAAVAKTPIYRCGQTYTQTPCPDGHLIDSADPRTAAQRAEAARVAEREKDLARKMERERQAAEAASAPTAITISAAAASAPASAAAKGKKKASKAAHAASGPGVVFIAPRPMAQK